MNDRACAEYAAKEAGKILKHFYGGVFSSHRKSDGTIVTEADIASQKKIIEILEQHSPYPILSEEKSEKPHTATRWLVDPLDGTNNFKRHIPFFSLSIALQKDGELILGVVYNPITEEMFSAEKGGGAFLNEKKITCGTIETVASALVALSSGSSENEKKRFNHFLGSVARSGYPTVRKFGSIALEICYVASGSLDGAVSSGTGIEDVAAGACILREASGVTTTWEGDAVTQNDRGSVMATNKGLANELQHLLQ